MEKNSLFFKFSPLYYGGFWAKTQHKNLLYIKEMVAAAVVMLPAGLAVSRVPNLLNAPKGLGLRVVHLLDQVGVHLLAVAHPFLLNGQRLVEKVVLAGDDVHEVSDAPRGVVCAV